VAEARDDPERERRSARFSDFAATGDPAIRDELVNAHLGLAHHLARRFANRGIPLEDLVQVASLGLVNAVDRFDPSRGLEFSTFATPTIVGELKRWFRDKGWSVRVPRQVQELHVRLNSVMAPLTNQLGRSPTIAELAEATSHTPEEVIEAMEAARSYDPASLDSPGGETGATLNEHLASDDADMFQAEDRLVVDQLLSLLPRREQLMVRLRYFDGMTQTEIAERLGISQMHVSRLLARSLDTLRAATQRETDQG
jgi:RNA polymerase sigma-B factor